MILPDFDGIIFDMDGTLMESLGVWADCDRKFVNSLGFEYDSSISHSMKSMHYASACEFLREKFCPEMSAEEISARIMRLVRDSYVNDIPLKPYAAEFVDMQYGRGIKMCVATSNLKQLAIDALSALKIADKLEFVLTSDEVGCGKESPDIFLAAAKKMGCKPDRTVVFEDSPHAVESAASAGFYTVGVYDGKYSADYESLKSTADITISSYKELL